jgi:glycosyltransferase involved in cell wall biosynthesis
MIPAYNEEETIGEVIKEIPRKIGGINEIEVLIINDGSTDKTSEAAKNAGADKIIEFSSNRGLALAFKEGFNSALEMGADIIVNTDADGQYDNSEIPNLIKPIIEGKADIVLGNRQVANLKHMPVQKRVGNRIATGITRLASGVKITDAQTGFRAFSREAAMKISILHGYTYTQETIIAASHKGLKITEVPIVFRKREGKSRLISNIWTYAKKSGSTIVRAYTFYNPLKTFLFLGGSITLLGFLVGLRVLFHFFETGKVSPFLPTALLSALLIIVGFQVMVIGLVGDMIHHLRYLVEEILYYFKKDK